MLLQLAAVCNDQLLCGRASFGAQLPHLLHHVHAVSHPAKSHVFEVQVLGRFQRDEELGVVGVASAVGHRQDPGAGVSDVKVLILKLAAVDGLASRTVTVGDVTALRRKCVR